MVVILGHGRRLRAGTYEQRRTTPEDRSVSMVSTKDRLRGSTAITRAIDERVKLSSRPEDSHLRALPDPYVNLSIHTAPDVRPFP